MEENAPASAPDRRLDPSMEAGYEESGKNKADIGTYTALLPVPVHHCIWELEE